MPELPEVETVVRSIAPAITGSSIQSAQFSSKLVTRSDFERTALLLRGCSIESVSRVGKHIVIQLNRGFLHVHLGMTGKLLWNAPQTPYTRVVLELDKGTLVFDDIRQFGRFNHYDQLPPSVAKLGVDALAIGFEQFFPLLHTRHIAVKAFLLNQRYVSGIGNIYADEMLFAAGIHPRAKASRISRSRALKLYDAMGQILRNAIEHRGSSISDYVDASGARGGFQLLHRVYGKTGMPCGLCGMPIRRSVVAQRGTHYCPRCQRA